MRGGGPESPECGHEAGGLGRPLLVRDYITGDPFSVGYCAECSLHVTAPVPPEAQVARYYPPRYYGSGKRFVSPVEWFLDSLYGFRASRFSKGQRPGAVLDIGCGRGLLLNKLREQGWEVHGTELSEEAARYAREVLNLSVSTEPLAAAGFSSDQFDLIILWHVLEHVRAPRAFLREVARILKPRGTLLVGVPNFASWEAVWSGEHWFHLDVPRHLTHFTPASLSATLEEVGMSVVSSAYLSPEFDFFGFVQSVQNKMGFAPNLLYNLMRLRTARLLDDGPPRARDGLLHRLLVLITAPLLGAVSVIWVPVLAMVGKGATVTVRAVKTGGQRE